MHINLVVTPTMAVHPVAVNAASLAIVVTRWKGSDPSFLVQVDKVSIYKGHNFCIGIVLTRPLILTFPLPGAIGSPHFGSPSLSLAVESESIVEVLVALHNWKPNPPA